MKWFLCTMSEAFFEKAGSGMLVMAIVFVALLAAVTAFTVLALKRNLSDGKKDGK